MSAAMPPVLRAHLQIPNRPTRPKRTNSFSRGAASGNGGSPYVRKTFGPPPAVAHPDAGPDLGGMRSWQIAGCACAFTARPGGTIGNLPYGTLRARRKIPVFRIEPWIWAIGGRRSPRCAQTKDDPGAQRCLPRNGDG
jgi:hypothetical protein